MRSGGEEMAVKGVKRLVCGFETLKQDCFAEVEANYKLTCGNLSDAEKSSCGLEFYQIYEDVFKECGEAKECATNRILTPNASDIAKLIKLASTSSKADAKPVKDEDGAKSSVGVGLRLELGYSALTTSEFGDNRPGLGTYVKDYGAMARDSFQNGFGVSLISNFDKLLEGGFLLRIQKGIAEPQYIYGSSDAVAWLLIASPFAMLNFYSLTIKGIDVQISGGLSVDGYFSTSKIIMGSIGKQQEWVLGVTPFVKIEAGPLALTAGVPITDFWGLNRVNTSFDGEKGVAEAVSLAGQGGEQAFMVMLSVILGGK